MLIAGAGGFAVQLIDGFAETAKTDVVFWSETKTPFSCIEDNYAVLMTDAAVSRYFEETSRQFVVGIWDVAARRRLIEKFEALGGELSTLIMPVTYVSRYSTVREGSVFLFQAATEPEVQIGKACLVNKRAAFGHGCVVSDFCSIGPYAIIGSDVRMGENCYVGVGAVVQPKCIIGENVTIAAGSTVTKNIRAGSVVSGSPARLRFLRKTGITSQS